MYRFKQFTLLIGDLASLYLGLYFALYLRYMERPEQNLAILFSPITLLFAVAALILFIAGLYDIGRAKNVWPFYQRILISAAIWTGLGMMYFYVRPKQNVAPKTILLLTTTLGFSVLSIWRFVYNKFISTSLLQSNIIFAGITNEVAELLKYITEQPQIGYVTTGIISNNPADKERFQNIAFGEKISDIYSQTNTQANIIVLSPHMAGNENLLRELYKSLFSQASIISLSDFYETLLKKIPPFTFSEGWFVVNLHEQQKKIYDRFKIIVDYALAVILSAFFLITLPLVALLIKINSKGPIFFRQTRIGRQEKIFTVFKYRTMKALSADGSAETQGPQFATDKDSRVTLVGKLLRKSRIDEVPQFINILKGDMSLIGPRPERPEFVQQLTEKMPYYALRHLVKPGLTGWAQIHNAYYGTIEENLEKLEYDLYYIKNRNLTLDISIILRTFNILARMIGR